MNVFGSEHYSLLTAQDNVTQRSYRLEIFRTAISNSSGPAVDAADLISLSLLADEKALALSPAFKGNILSYTAETTAKKVYLTAKTLYMDARVSLLGNKLQDGVALELIPGDNAIKLQVTHPSGPSRTYTITIHHTIAEPTPTVALNDITGNWAETEMRKAVAEGWVTGYPDDSFHPEREVTRAEFVNMLAKSLGWKELDQSTSFADNSSIPPWSLPYIAEAVKQGLVNGMENNRFDPNGLATRAEAVVIITRLLNQK